MAGDGLKKVPGLLSLVLLLALTLTASRCNDEKQFAWRGQDLIFVIPAQVLPDYSEVTIGDTLWVTAAISDMTFLRTIAERYTMRLPIQ